MGRVTLVIFVLKSFWPVRAFKVIGVDPCEAYSMGFIKPKLIGNGNVGIILDNVSSSTVHVRYPPPQVARCYERRLPTATNGLWVGRQLESTQVVFCQYFLKHLLTGETVDAGIIDLEVLHV